MIEKTFHSKLEIGISQYFLFCLASVNLSSSPTKQGELMGMGIPIICNSGVGDVDLIVEKYQSGYVVPNVNQLNLDELLNKKFEKANPEKGSK